MIGPAMRAVPRAFRHGGLIDERDGAGQIRQDPVPGTDGPVHFEHLPEIRLEVRRKALAELARVGTEQQTVDGG